MVGASLTVPFCTIVLRKGYGLGAMAMAGGSFKAGLFSMAWPTGEFGGMGLEGAVKLGFRMQISAFTDPPERRALSVARRIRRVLSVCPPEKLMLNPDCGFGWSPRYMCNQKLRGLAAGAALVRSELTGKK